jgi:alpha-tubulin suppressor-like RCC1 family protein
MRVIEARVFVVLSLAISVILCSQEARAQLSHNDDLIALEVSAGTLSPPTFNSARTNYSDLVFTNSLIVTPTASNVLSTIQVQVNGGGFATEPSGTPSAPLPLTPGTNTVEVNVTSQDGVRSKSYLITVARLAPDSNADLSTLSLSSAPISPTFNSNIVNYTASVPFVPNPVYVYVVQAKPGEPTSTYQITVNGVAVYTNQQGAANFPASLNVGTNVIVLQVTAQDSTTVKTYTLQVERAQVKATIAAGIEHSLFLKPDGSLWGMGRNEAGQLGIGYLWGSLKPVLIISNDVAAIAAGDAHSLFVKADGSLWAMGINTSGQLGDGTGNLFTNLPEQILSSGVAAVAAGMNHSLFLKSDGTVWGMGDNASGQLDWIGLPLSQIPTPVRVPPFISNVVAIAASASNSWFVTADGSAWLHGDFTVYSPSLQGTCYVSPPYSSASVPQLTNGVLAVAAGRNHALFRKSDGSLWVLGDNQWGELGDGTLDPTGLCGLPGRHDPEQIVSRGVTSIAAGNGHSLFLKSDGSLWAMGRNNHGQLGDGTLINSDSAKQIVSGGVAAIAAGESHSLFIKSDGSLWGMGIDLQGQLGDGFYTNSLLPEQIFPAPQPTLSMNFLYPYVGGFSFQTNLQFNATCAFGGKFVLLASTNPALPVSLWTALATNTVSSYARSNNNFSVSVTNVLGTGPLRQFFLLQGSHN